MSVLPYQKKSSNYTPSLFLNVMIRHLSATGHRRFKITDDVGIV